MSNPIVAVNVSVLSAPTPSTLQKTGAFISQGATNTSPGTKTLLAQLSSLTPILTGALAISSITQSGGNALATTTAPHGFTVGDKLLLTVAGANQSSYNGAQYCTITGASTFTFSVPSSTTSPATGTIIYTLEDVSELLAMATTFFAQGSGQGVYVLELGAGNATDGCAFLTTWIAANPGVFYSYLVPRYWDGNAAFLALAANFEATTAKTYFFVTTSLQNWQAYTSAMKSIVAMVECPEYGVWAQNALISLSQTAGVASAVTTTNHNVLPGDTFQLAGNLPAGWNGYFEAGLQTTAATLEFGVPSSIGAETQLGELLQSLYASSGIPSTEFSHASDYWVTLNYKPSSTNKVTPLNLSYLFGVTPFPTQGNASILSELNAGNINVVGTGAQGGISEDILIGGNTMDGNPFNFWYSVDWVQINAQLNVTAALIQGSNNPINPIYYDQQGINALQQVLISTMTTGITNGLVLNPVKLTTLDAADFAAALNAGTYDGYTVVNAEPFQDYIAENPNAYAAGSYGGFSIVYTPLRGFESITINITVSNFAA
jgi:hypothetical protein